MTPDTHENYLDTMLTLRGHRISLRQAIAEGIIKGDFNSEKQQAEIECIDSNWFLDRLDHQNQRLCLR